ncbi:hypothetical protein V6N13_018601 [Hibiscus sabdariffa]
MTASKIVDWKKLFEGAEEHTLDYFPPARVEGTVAIAPPSSVFDDGIADWKYALVGQFVGSAPNFSSLQIIIQIIWGKDSTVKNKPLVLRKWEPNLKRLDFDLCRMPIWIQLFNVPLELYNRKGLSYISSALGMPLYMDSITASKECLQFAKVCVEIEAGSKLPSTIDVVMKDRSITVEKGPEKDKVVKVWKVKPIAQTVDLGEPSSKGELQEGVQTDFGTVLGGSESDINIGSIIVSDSSPVIDGVDAADMDLAGIVVHEVIQTVLNDCGIDHNGEAKMINVDCPDVIAGFCDADIIDPATQAILDSNNEEFPTL